MPKISCFLLPDNSLNRIITTVKSVIIMLYFVHCSTVQANVSVNISIEEPQHHYAQISIKYDKFDRNTVNFHLPTWRTGRYEILNLANGIREFSAQDGRGKKLIKILGKYKML